MCSYYSIKKHYHVLIIIKQKKIDIDIPDIDKFKNKTYINCN